MELVDRYLQAVKFWLPKAEARDIIAELSEDIRSLVEEREGQLRRELTEDEVGDILQKWGSPILVAQRYLPQEYLIGPTLYPIYRLVMKWALIFYGVPWLLIWLCFLIFDPSYRSGDPFAAFNGLWATLIFGFAAFTAGFATVEHYQSKTKFLAKFSLRSLPPAKDPNQISRCTSVSEAMMYGMTTLWWVGALRVPNIPGVSVQLSDVVIRYYYWPVLVFLVALTGICMLNTIRPWWTRWRSGIRLAINIYGIILVVLLLGSGPFLEVSVPGASGAGWQAVTNWLRVSIAVTFVLSAGVYLIRAVQDWLRASGREPMQHWSVRMLIGE